MNEEGNSQTVSSQADGDVQLGREKLEAAIAKVHGSDQQPADGGQAILYNSGAKQRIPFMIEFGGEMFEVAFVLDAQTDNALINYDRLCDRRFFAANQKETGERNAVESVDKSFDAAIWLFNDRAISAEGFGEPGEQLPNDWKDSIADADKAAVIDEAYLAAGVVPLPIATPGRVLPLNYGKNAPISTIHLRALFEGNELTLGHVMRPATADQVATYKAIQKERLIVQGTRLNKGETRIPPKARKLGALYDQLMESVTGYVNDHVPLHHKMVVAIEHLTSEVEAVRKN
jgi:hypothetical protein